MNHICSAFNGQVYKADSRLIKSIALSMKIMKNEHENKSFITEINTKSIENITNRRMWMRNSSNTLFGLFFVSLSSNSNAMDESLQVSEEELQETYDNPNQPKSPEERSGLVVLRVAEVAQFQEKILRSIASGELEGVMVSPMQFVFGTDILLKNSNLDGNMKLMIYQEIPKKRRDEAIQNAIFCMNQLQSISRYAGAIQRDFKTEEMIELADMYRDLRVNLNQLYEYLPDKEKDKYYGYFVAVTEYEKKIAEGTYNPDLDGILQFDNSTPKRGYQTVF